jgi:alpha-ketoglutarate-dependent taurine dioxygenase
VLLSSNRFLFSPFVSHRAGTSELSYIAFVLELGNGTTSRREGKMNTNPRDFVTYTTVTCDEVSQSSLPLILRAGQEGSSASPERVLQWLAEDRDWLRKELHRYGAILLRGFRALRTAEHFERAMRQVAEELLDYTAGNTPRSAVQGKILSSTDAPPHLTIGLHQEMSYLEPSAELPDPTPDLVGFFCQVEPGGGGQTPLCDMRLVYQRLPSDLVQRFEKRGLMLTRQLPETKKAGYEVTWPTVLGSERRIEAEAFARRRGWRIVWTDDGGACLFQNPSPVVKEHHVTGEKVWFNQAHLLHKHYAPWTTDFLGPSAEQKLAAERLRPQLSSRFFFQTTHADGTEIEISDLECIRHVIAETMVMFDWQSSDLLICDNKLVAHGRQPYQPPRTILAALASDRRPSQGCQKEESELGP